jgi:hypothetical protein
MPNGNQRTAAMMPLRVHENEEERPQYMRRVNTNLVLRTSFQVHVRLLGGKSSRDDPEGVSWSHFHAW